MLNAHLASLMLNAHLAGLLLWFLICFADMHEDCSILSYMSMFVLFLYTHGCTVVYFVCCVILYMDAWFFTITIMLMVRPVSPCVMNCKGVILAFQLWVVVCSFMHLCETLYMCYCFALWIVVYLWSHTLVFHWSPGVQGMHLDSLLGFLASYTFKQQKINK
jgi:hypothetical protein